MVEALIGQSLILSVPETSITLQKAATVEIRVFHFAHDVVDQVLDPIAHLCPESGQQLIGFESDVFPGFFEIGWEFKTSEHLGYIFFIEVGFDVVIVKLFHADRTGATFVLWTVLDCAEQFGSSGVIAHINYYQRSVKGVPSWSRHDRSSDSLLLDQQKDPYYFLPTPQDSMFKHKIYGYTIPAILANDQDNHSSLSKVTS